MNLVARGYPGSVPLYRCSDCGFVTTASHADAVAAHEGGSPWCAGAPELIADFKRTVPVVSPARGRRRAVAPQPEQNAARQS